MMVTGVIACRCVNCHSDIVDSVKHNRECDSSVTDDNNYKSVSDTGLASDVSDMMSRDSTDMCQIQRDSGSDTI